MTTPYAALVEFVEGHRAHGVLTGVATEPEERGYMLTVACPCGVVFERWVTPESAVRELVWTPLIHVRGLKVKLRRESRFVVVGLDVDESGASLLLAARRGRTLSYVDNCVRAAPDRGRPGAHERGGTG